MDDTSKTNLLELISDREGQAELLANSGHSKTTSSSSSKKKPSKMVGKEIDVDEEMAKVKELAKMGYPPQQAAKSAYPQQDSKQPAPKKQPPPSKPRATPRGRSITSKAAISLPPRQRSQRGGVVDVDAIPRSKSPAAPSARFRGKKPLQRATSAPTAAAAYRGNHTALHRTPTSSKNGNSVALSDESELDLLGIVAQRCAHNNEVDCDECHSAHQDLEQGRANKMQKTNSMPSYHYTSQQGKQVERPTITTTAQHSSRSVASVAAKHARKAARSSNNSALSSNNSAVSRDHSRRTMTSSDSDSTSASTSCKDACCNELDLGSEVELMQLVAQRIVDLEASDLDMESTTSDADVSGFLYDVEVGPSMRTTKTKPSRAMTDASAVSMDTSDLKAVRSQSPTPGKGQPRTPNNLTAGAYSAAPGQGYVRNDAFATTSLCQPMAVAAMATMQQDAAVEQHPMNGSMMDGSTKSNKSTGAAASAGDIISAVRVDEDDLELHIREQIHSTAAQAQVVDMDKETGERMKSELQKVQKQYAGFGILCVMFLAVAVAAVVVSVTQRQQNTDAVATSIDDGPVFLSTLQSIADRGTLNCGLGYRGDDADFHPEYQLAWEGFIGDICKAIAAGVLGGNPEVNFQLVNEEERWKKLQRGELDVLIVGCPAITESLYFDVDTEVKAAFSTSFLFDGVGVGGLPEFVENCATNTGGFRACRDMRVCVTQGSHALDVLERRLHPSQIVAVPTLQEVYDRFAGGCCNMLSTDFMNERADVVVREFSGYKGEYALGAGLYSKQPYSGATRKMFEKDLLEIAVGLVDDIARENDPRVWSEYVNWVINSLFAAEQNNITQATANYITQTDVFGEKYRDVFHHAVAAAGNYGEIYERTLGPIIPRDGMNLVNDGSTGLHYHHSLGSVNTFGTVNPNGTLDNVLKKGKLVCGIPAFQNTNFTLGPGEIATLPPSGHLSNSTNHNATFHHEANTLVGEMDRELKAASIDIEFCRALSSSLFQGLHTSNKGTESCSAASSTNDDDSDSEDLTLEFVLLTDEAEGYTKLQSGELDVIAGYRIDLQGDVREPTTGQGYAYTQPYLYGPVSEVQHVTSNNRCMVTRQNDRQWSDFVHMVVMAIFYAEENHIDQDHANQMPAVNNFGPAMKRMFRDAVFAVGSYAEVYERLVEPFIPREGGPNTLNSEADPQLAALPGLI
ncbi:extracellular solute-binding protein [Seminavis robusta]|uniref:Extracellular solute-binding protein n=1 Tax=Seminavis robusta TaxID=568900 RepID=A0A9N8E9J5_9STRA|nr:extracellular solute-binding protein [Seminavis robusta]|eukprot:Sro844_g209930.1 extracellular solute-binding protein (1194) ;mRNA; f:38921-42781